MDGILWLEEWSLDDAGLLEVEVLGHLDGETGRYQGQILLDSEEDWPESESDQIKALKGWAVIDWEPVVWERKE